MNKFKESRSKKKGRTKKDRKQSFSTEGQQSQKLIFS